MRLVAEPISDILVLSSARSGPAPTLALADKETRVAWSEALRLRAPLVAAKALNMRVSAVFIETLASLYNVGRLIHPFHLLL